MIEEITDNNIITTNNQANNLEVQNTDYNKQFTTLSEIIECPICLTEIENNDAILIVECCNQKIHLSCITEWYTKYPDNKTCFMCNQSNKFCKDFVYNNSLEIDSNASHNDLSNSTNSTIIEVNSNNLNINRLRTVNPKITCCLLTFGLTGVIIGIIILFNILFT
jgi:hypothetical protein